VRLFVREGIIGSHFYRLYFLYRLNDSSFSDSELNELLCCIMPHGRWEMLKTLFQATSVAAFVAVRCRHTLGT